MMRCRCGNEIHNIPLWLAEVANFTCQSCAAGPRPVILDAKTRRCRGCNKSFPVEEFAKYSDGQGFYATCNACRKYNRKSQTKWLSAKL